jgi:hypothetical protein
MKPSVYLETTIPSYLTAGPTVDPVRAGRQQTTIDWWAKRSMFDLYASRLVVQECEAGNPDLAALRISSLFGVPLLEQSDTALELAEALVTSLQLPAKAEADALHISIATVNGVRFLLTWNCTHIANAALRVRIERVCRAAGFEPPTICTPDELLGEEFSDD